jgi:Peptidase S46
MRTYNESRIRALTRLPILFLIVACSGVAGATVPADTVRAGRYDNGKMWTFEYPPVDYLAETYDFRPDADWFERARMSVLRIPGCSASFVSSHGLVVTNHHCVRSRVSQVSREDENLLDTGFYAPTLADERKIPGYYADQLIAIEDVTDEVDLASMGINGDQARDAAREKTINSIRERIEKKRSDIPGLNVQIIPLYNGGRYSAYIFRRYSDVRLVMAVELQAGFFGGDGDNFTYPRYALDYSFLRIYGDDGKPVESPFNFGWSKAGVEEGDLVFVIGNPGSTSRQATVSQLEFFRDVLVDHTLRTLNDRLQAYRAFYAEDPVRGEELDLRNTIFSISNSQKAYSGRSDALRDPDLIARRADAERSFRASIGADPDLKRSYAGVFDQVEAIQEQKRKVGNEYGAFRLFENSRYESALLRRAILARRYLNALGQDSVEASRSMDRLLKIDDRPEGLDRRLLSARLKDFNYYFSDHRSILESLFGVSDVADTAERLLTGSDLVSKASTEKLIAAGLEKDPAVVFISKVFDRYESFSKRYAELTRSERKLQSMIGRARFAVYGVEVPPDATFSPRFTDGIVKGYRYNGTLAPPYTTLFGMLDHYYSYGGNPDWILPERLRRPPPDLNLATPLNFVSTSDTIGGNSGSPAVTRNLEIVGLNFDRNIEGLSRDYIYLPERGRNVMVDVRAVLETLDKIYDADRIVLELTTGTLFESEDAADASGGN